LFCRTCVFFPPQVHPNVGRLLRRAAAGRKILRGAFARLPLWFSLLPANFAFLPPRAIFVFSGQGFPFSFKEHRMSVNKVILVGRLGRDPETRYTSGGQAVANFSMATDETYKDRNGERQKRTEWHKIVVWGKQAEIAQQYLKKGSLVFIEGRIQSREWQDKEGQKRTAFEIVANNFRMLGGRGDGMAAGAGAGAGAGASRGAGAGEDYGHDSAGPSDDFGPSANPEISDEDIPF
jgi:single-strand DNA-binding protein